MRSRNRRRALCRRYGHHGRRKSYRDIAADIVARRQALWTDVLEPATRAPVAPKKVTRPKKPRVIRSGKVAEDARAKRILELESTRAELKSKEARYRHEQHAAEVEEQACSTRALKKISALAGKAGRAKEEAAKKEAQIQELLREAMR